MGNPAIPPQARPSVAEYRNPDLRRRTVIRAAARQWPRGRYVQAFLMYPRRWLYRVVALWMAFGVAISMCILYSQLPWYEAAKSAARQWIERPGAIDLLGPDLVSGLGAVVALFVLPGATAIAAHVRQQVTDYRGAALPNFRAPHVVAGAVMLAVVILVAATATWAPAGPYTFVGLLAVTAAVAAVGAGCASLPPRGIAVVGVGSVAIFSVRNVRLWIAYGLTGLSDPVTATLLSLSVASLVAVFAYLLLTRAERAPAARDSELVLGRGARWRRRPGESPATMRVFRRLQLWRVASSTGLMPPACGAALLVLIVVLLVAQPEQRSYFVSVSIPLAGLSILLPAAAVTAQWTRRLPSLGYELARPTTRPAFVRHLGLAMAADWAYWWGCLTLGGSLGIAYAVYVATTRNDVRFAPGGWNLYATGLASSAATQVLLYAIVVWTLRFQATWSIYLLTLLATLLSWIPTVYLLDDRAHWTPGGTTLALGCLVAPAAVVVADAYRRWLTADLR